MTRLVLKLGGNVVGSADPVLELAAGQEVCVVHGAGSRISAEMRRRGIEIRFVGGRRVTTPETMEVVRETLAQVNAELCEAIGERALGLMGDEIGLQAVPVPELGLVGRPLPVRPPAIEQALADGLVPVLAPVAAGPLNVNADDAAAALAAGLEADRLLFVTDVPGVLREGALIPALGVDEADRLLGSGAFQGGIVPKLHAAVRAARLGVRTEIGATAVLP